LFLPRSLGFSSSTFYIFHSPARAASGRLFLLVLAAFRRTAFASAGYQRGFLRRASSAPFFFLFSAQSDYIFSLWSFPFFQHGLSMAGKQAASSGFSERSKRLLLGYWHEATDLS
jgi:hypothetical protein